MSAMDPANVHVSVIDPINPAVERVKTLLFAPFDLARWFVIGFAAWLAQLGHGFARGGNPGGGHGGSPGQFTRNVPSEIHKATGYVGENIVWIVPLAVVGFILAVAIVLLIVWLSSRGRFMFLDCVARHRAAVRDPWYRFKPHADSLFAFRVVVVIIFFAVTIVALLPVGFFFWTAERASLPGVPILGAILLGIFFFLVAILFAIIGEFTTDFVAPIMYLHTVSCTQGWRILLDLLSMNVGRFVLYLLFQILLKIAIAIVVTGATCLTCGIACCFLALPYIGTVFLLPILVFQRSYSLYYLSQYGPQFNVFAPPAAPAQPA
jgi:hypothetical protein